MLFLAIKNDIIKIIRKKEKNKEFFMSQPKKKNNLTMTHPELAKEWHPIKNGDLTPEQVTYGLGIKVWWQCEKGHEWQAFLGNRSIKGSKCPICRGVCLIPGTNDLATKQPELAKQWHPTKNGELTPHEVLCGSSKRVWWQCEKGHEWQTIIANRVSKKTSCPYCSGKRLLIGVNDLATKRPHLIKDWHPTKNGDLTPDQVTCGSQKRAWWQCSNCDHEWNTVIASRGINRTNCPQCVRNERYQRKNA